MRREEERGENEGKMTQKTFLKKNAMSKTEKVAFLTMIKAI
jgi:hypothetical protein